MTLGDNVGSSFLTSVSSLGRMVMMARLWTGEMGEMKSIIPAQLCCEPKTTLKNKVYIKKKNSVPAQGPA